MLFRVILLRQLIFPYGLPISRCVWVDHTIALRVVDGIARGLQKCQRAETEDLTLLAGNKTNLKRNAI